MATCRTTSPPLPSLCETADNPKEFLWHFDGNATDENHGAQTVLLALCGFSSPNWPKAADLPERQEVRYTILFFMGTWNFSNTGATLNPGNQSPVREDIACFANGSY